MTVRELIIHLLDMPLDMEVRRSAGEDPMANLSVSHAEVCRSYHPQHPRTGVRTVVIR